MKSMHWSTSLNMNLLCLQHMEVQQNFPLSSQIFNSIFGFHKHLIITDKYPYKTLPYLEIFCRMAGQNSQINFWKSISCSVIPRTHLQRPSISHQSLTSHIHGCFQIQYPVRSSILHTPTERNEAITHSSPSHVGIFRWANSHSPGFTTPPTTLPPSYSRAIVISDSLFAIKSITRPL